MPDAVEFIRGYYGKVPVRGDFVHAGFPRDFNDPWHDWQSRVIAGSRTIMGEAWLDAFLEAPVWRFVLSGGLCGARAAIGLILPSVDKVGRYFPLTLAALSDAGTPDAEAWSGWLDSVEDLGRQALDDDAPPEHLLPPPAPSATSFVDGTISTWWTDGGPRVEPTRLTLACLPDAPCYASMLGHPAATESAL